MNVNGDVTKYISQSTMSSEGLNSLQPSKESRRPRSHMGTLKLPALPSAKSFSSFGTADRRGSIFSGKSGKIREGKWSPNEEASRRSRGSASPPFLHPGSSRRSPSSCRAHPDILVDGPESSSLRKTKKGRSRSRSTEYSDCASHGMSLFKNPFPPFSVSVGRCEEYSGSAGENDGSEHQVFVSGGEVEDEPAVRKVWSMPGSTSVCNSSSPVRYKLEKAWMASSGDSRRKSTFDGAEGSSSHKKEGNQLKELKSAMEQVDSSDEETFSSIVRVWSDVVQQEYHCEKQDIELINDPGYSLHGGQKSARIARDSIVKSPEVASQQITDRRRRVYREIVNTEKNFIADLRKLVWVCGKALLVPIQRTIFLQTECS